MMDSGLQIIGQVPDTWKRIPVKVYHAYPLVEVFAFDQLFVVGQDTMNSKWMRDHLEFYFKEFNIGQTQLADGYRAKDLRPLGSGDVIVIGETAWLCEFSGWRLLTTEEFKEKMK